MSTLHYFLKWEKETPDRIFFKQPFNGTIKTWTYAEAGNEIRKILSGFQSLDLAPGAHIAILSKNCAQWIMADLAIMMGGYVSIPIYPTLTAASIKPILEHSDSKAVVIGKLDDYSTQIEGIPDGMIKVGVNMYDIDEDYSWEKWVESNMPSDYVHVWKPEDLLTIMYTSGTTGRPKGVMHSVNAFDATAKVAIEDLEIIPKGINRMFSYLPLSHIAERLGIETVGIYLGSTFSFAETLESFAENLAETQPNVFFAVPRIWAKFREKIEEKLPPAKLNLLLKIPIISGVIKKSIKKKLGLSEAWHIFSGAAPITVEMIQWYEKLDIKILQAYGMTEDSVYSHFNRNNNNNHGTVGLPLKGLEVKISDEGEIRLKSAGLTLGYYKEPQMTQELFDEEGFLRTGDVGERDSKGFLTITGRIKDQFKTDKGKYIAPAPIEMQLATNSDIESVCVVGMGVPQPLAMVVLSPVGMTKTKDEIKASLAKTIKEANAGLESYEQVNKAVIMNKAWTVENNLMTPTLKVKRNEVEKIHLPKYPSWYQMPGTVIWEQ